MSTGDSPTCPGAAIYEMHVGSTTSLDGDFSGGKSRRFSSALLLPYTRLKPKVFRWFHPLLEKQLSHIPATARQAATSSGEASKG